MGCRSVVLGRSGGAIEDEGRVGINECKCVLGVTMVLDLVDTAGLCDWTDGCIWASPVSGDGDPFDCGTIIQGWLRVPCQSGRRVWRIDGGATYTFLCPLNPPGSGTPSER